MIFIDGIDYVKRISDAVRLFTLRTSERIDAPSPTGVKILLATLILLFALASYIYSTNPHSLFNS